MLCNDEMGFGTCFTFIIQSLLLGIISGVLCFSPGSMKLLPTDQNIIAVRSVEVVHD